VRGVLRTAAASSGTAAMAVINFPSSAADVPTPVVGYVSSTNSVLWCFKKIRMPTGTCRLCLMPEVELRDSHFVPRAFYKRFHERGTDNIQPVTASATKSMLSGKQASDYLLCDHCEQRFNRGGEQWVVANCWHDPADFPLRNRLLAVGPSALSSPDFTIFESRSIPDVDCDRLVYFGASIIWRAAVHKWRMPAGDPLPISLGPYENAFRQYLLGETQFPCDAVMLVSVSYSRAETNNKSFTLPWLFKREGGHHQFKLIVPGLTYLLCVGKSMPDGLRRMCTARSEKGFVYMSERTDGINLRGHLAMLKTSRRLGRLAKTGGILFSDPGTTC
jgi:hypothetical protein